MARTEIAFVFGLKVWVGCQDKLCVHSDADEYSPNGRADR